MSVRVAARKISELYAWYALALLIVAYVFSFIDRQILSLLVEPMKRDLDISDTQISFLQGLAFALFYATMGLPIGRMVDRRKRVNVIAAGVFLWSLMTALCGVARNYGQIFLFRMGVGVGEAALSPGAYSMVSDSFKPERQGLALGLYSMGIYIGAGLALVIGGLVVQWAEAAGSWSVPFFGAIHSWQIVFLVVGLPGIPLALWIWTLREPERKGLREGEDHVPIGEVASYMRGNLRTLICHHGSFAMIAMVGYGTAAWVPAFFYRTYGWEAHETGIIYGTLIAVFGTLGVVLGGWLGDYLCSRGHRNGKMRVHLICAITCLPVIVAAPLMPVGWLAMLMITPGIFCSSLISGVAPAGVQEIMPNRMRGTASAVMLFVVSLFGLGLGPTLIALSTDFLFRDEALLRYSLALVPGVLLCVGIGLAWAGLSSYTRTRDYLDDWLKSNQ